MKLCRIFTLRNKLSKLICFLIIFSISCIPVSANQMYSIMELQARFADGGQAVPASQPQLFLANLTQLELGEDFLFNADQNVVLPYFKIFENFNAAISQNGFNFDQALQIAGNNRMELSGIIDNSINQGSGDVNNAMNQIQSLFAANLNCSLSPNSVSTISKVIEDTFNTNISSSNYVVYSSKSGGENSYLFKVLAGSVLLEGHQAKLTLVPLEINVNVKVKTEKVLFITIRNTKHYDVSVKAHAYKKTITF